jgi:hypothetical protein
MTAEEQDKECHENVGHILRSQFLDCCADIEEWATQNCSKLKLKVQPKALLAQKLDKLKAEAESGKSRFRNPQHIAPLIGNIFELLEFRAKLVHSKLISAVMDDGRSIWMFSNVVGRKNPDQPFDLILDKAAFDKRLGEARGYIKKLNNQQLKEAAPDLPAASTGPASAR